MDGGGVVDGGGGVPGHPGGGDTVMTEAQPESQNSMMLMSAMATTTENISAMLSHGGRFIQYNIFDNIFEVTAKYKPPILLIGKGAYSIFCSALNSETNEHVALKKIVNAFDKKVDAKRTLREIKRCFVTWIMKM